jgi:hypothetical protein
MTTIDQTRAQEKITPVIDSWLLFSYSKSINIQQISCLQACLADKLMKLDKTTLAW